MDMDKRISPWIISAGVRSKAGGTTIRDLDGELSQGKENGSVAAALNYYVVALNTAEEKLKQETLKSLGFVLEFNETEHEQKKI